MTITALQVWCSSRKKGKKKRTPWTPSSSITLTHSQFTAKPPLAPTPFAALPRRVSRCPYSMSHHTLSYEHDI
ncbi:hypothetical protein ES288_D10G051300v1 [Gossypium darwinii]|nr:hypothetical protein ES288_D10G051300v1 [Gossypium darwinii]